MTLSLNERALALADRLAADAEALQVEVTTLSNGTRVIDCGAQARAASRRGGASPRSAWRGWGASPTRRWCIEGRWLPALTVTTDRPAVACLAAQYAGWRLDRDGYFAMGSGPGRALIRAEDLYDDLDWDEHASAAVLCLETRERAAGRRSPTSSPSAPACAPSALTLLMAPTASVAGGVQIAARVVETALHKLHELDFDVRRVVAGFGSCPLPPVAGDDMAALGRTNDAVLYGGQVHLTVEADDDDALRELVERLPASASSDYGEPFGKVLKAADFDFYKIDPLLFSPAQIRLTSVGSGRSFEAGRGQPRGAGALVLGLTVAILGSSGGWHAQQLTDALAARGHEHRLVPVTRMVGRIDGDVAIRTALDGCDAVIVRGIPRGSLEQVIFRVDALHVLGRAACRASTARARSSARSTSSSPRRCWRAPACRRRGRSPASASRTRSRPSTELGGDVIVKPLFGSMGAGMTRVDDADVAYRVFHALELERAVYYLQETLAGGRDLRAFVVGGRVLAAIERVGSGWRANLARGAERAADGAERRAGARVPGGGRGPGRRLRGRRPARRVRARAQRDPRLARAAGGDRRRRGGGARRAPRARQRARQLARR